MVKWLRSSKTSMVISTLIRLYLGFTWLMAGFEKVSSGKFSAEGMINMAIKNPVKDAGGQPAYDWYTSFLKTIVEPNVGLFDFLVQYGELLIGLGLILGTLTTAASFFAMGLNFTYLLAGTISTNPLLLLLEFIVLVAGFNAGKIGLDHWVVPFLRRKIPFLKRSVE